MVGYANDALTKAEWKSVCSQFIKIGSEDGKDMTLGDLKAGGGWQITDTLKILKKTSPATDFETTYVTWALVPNKVKKNTYGNDPANFTEGWYKLVDGSPAWDKWMNGTILEYGTCVLVLSSATDAFLTSNGEVVAPEGGEIVTQLTKSEWKFVGNCTPVALTLGNFKAGNGWQLTDTAKFLKKTSPATDFEATYVTWALVPNKVKKNTYGNDPSNFTEGWYKLVDGSPAWDSLMNSTEIPAGSGFLVLSSADAATITIPSAL